MATLPAPGLLWLALSLTTPGTPQDGGQDAPRPPAQEPRAEEPDSLVPA